MHAFAFVMRREMLLVEDEEMRQCLWQSSLVVLKINLCHQKSFHFGVQNREDKMVLIRLLRVSDVHPLVPGHPSEKQFGS